VIIYDVVSAPDTACGGMKATPLDTQLEIVVVPDDVPVKVTVLGLQTVSFGETVTHTVGIAPTVLDCAVEAIHAVPHANGPGFTSLTIE
jgi:hypothetical protein